MNPKDIVYFRPQGNDDSYNNPKQVINKNTRDNVYSDDKS